MRIIAKILAIPFTLVVAALSFLAALGGWLFSVAASILGLMGLLTLVMGGGAYAGIGLLVMAFLVSPYGIPAVADWFIDLLDSLNFSLKSFVAS